MTQKSKAQGSATPVIAHPLEDSIRATKTLISGSIDTLPPLLTEKNPGSLTGRVGPSVEKLRPAEIILIINGFIVRDKEVIDSFRQYYNRNVKSSKFYNSTRGFRKYGIASKDGILIIKMKKKVLIDLKKIVVGKTETNK